MRTVKCKICGSSMQYEEGTTTMRCPGCGFLRSLPNLNDEKNRLMYDQANESFICNEFDRADTFYEFISLEKDSEVYWSRMLCHYGIQYTQAPDTKEWKPVIRRFSYTSIYDDPRYKAAIQFGDDKQKEAYKKEAKEFEKLRVKILEISSRQEPFDVFISYKETDDQHAKTTDSGFASILYYRFADLGYKVFFAPETLKNKGGDYFEPYIYKAIHTAKVMIVLGSKKEFFYAPWIQNEWSRFLPLLKESESQKRLVPVCLQEMNPKDLPEKLCELQTIDVKTTPDWIAEVVKITRKAVGSGVDGRSLNNPKLQRAFLQLEYGQFDKVKEQVEKVLDDEPENPYAYIALLMADLKLKKQDDLKDCKEPFDKHDNYKMAVDFADAALKAKLQGYINHINARNENERLTKLYNEAVSAMREADSEGTYKYAANKFTEIKNFKDANEKAEECLRKAEECKLDRIYSSALKEIQKNTIEGYTQAIGIFASIPGWKDSGQKQNECLDKVEECRQDDIYNSALKEMQKNTIEGYTQAINLLTKIPKWKDAEAQAIACKYTAKNNDSDYNKALSEMQKDTQEGYQAALSLLKESANGKIREH